MPTKIKMIQPDPNVQKAIGIVNGMMAVLFARNPDAEEIEIDMDDLVVHSAVNALVTLLELNPNLDLLIPDDAYTTRSMLQGVKFYMAIGRNIDSTTP